MPQFLPPKSELIALWPYLRPRERAEIERLIGLTAPQAPLSLTEFGSAVDPTFTRPPHIELIGQLLERAVRRETKRLIICTPPRHGKSRLVSELLPAWGLGLDPTQQFMVVSHSVSLAETFSRNVRNIIIDERYAEIFPDTRLSRDSAAVVKWTLQGRMRPSMIALGVGGAPIGHGADVLIVDDPIANAEQAESALAREGLYQWYTQTIYSRLEPDAVVIVMMQRWHEDDLIGRLIRDQAFADRWEIVNMPALAEGQAARDETNRMYGLPDGLPDPIGRAPGEALWPQRFPPIVLHGIRRVSARSFEAKYQQRPRPAEGSKFKRGWFRIVDSAPAGLRWVRYWDLAYSLRQHADNTATIAAALGGDGTLYLRRGRAAQLESPDARRLIRQTMLEERDTRHGIEKAVHGGPVVQELLRDPELASISIRAIDVHADKLVRATPLADRAEAGKVVFVAESVNDQVWIAEWIDELCAFPFGEHDDRVDAASGALQMIGTPADAIMDYYARKASTLKGRPTPVAADDANRIDVEWYQRIKQAAETGKPIELLAGLDDQRAGNIMAELAAQYIDEKQDVKAIIILNERQRLGL